MTETLQTRNLRAELEETEKEILITEQMIKTAEDDLSRLKIMLHQQKMKAFYTKWHISNSIISE